MTNSAYHKLVTGFEATYNNNDYFKKYVDENFKGTIDVIYGNLVFSTEDMKAARKFWKQNQKAHPNYPWFDHPYDTYEWVENMPFGGYEY